MTTREVCEEMIAENLDTYIIDSWICKDAKNDTFDNLMKEKDWNVIICNGWAFTVEYREGGGCGMGAYPPSIRVTKQFRADILSSKQVEEAIKTGKAGETTMFYCDDCGTEIHKIV